MKCNGDGCDLDMVYDKEKDEYYCKPCNRKISYGEEEKEENGIW